MAIGCPAGWMLYGGVAGSGPWQPHGPPEEGDEVSPDDAALQPLGLHELLAGPWPGARPSEALAGGEAAEAATGGNRRSDGQEEADGAVQHRVLLLLRLRRGRWHLRLLGEREAGQSAETDQLLYSRQQHLGVLGVQWRFQLLHLWLVPAWPTGEPGNILRAGLHQVPVNRPGGDYLRGAGLEGGGDDRRDQLPGSARRQSPRRLSTRPAVRRHGGIHLILLLHLNELRPGVKSPDNGASLHRACTTRSEILWWHQPASSRGI